MNNLLDAAVHFMNYCLDQIYISGKMILQRRYRTSIRAASSS